jgi:hypothetical protein
MASKELFDKTKRAPPSHYLARASSGKNWMKMKWHMPVKSWADAEKLVQKWNKWNLDSWWEYRLPLHCERCYHTCSETYPTFGLEAGLIGKHVCSTCHNEGLENMKKVKMYKPASHPWEPANLGGPPTPT